MPSCRVLELQEHSMVKSRVDEFVEDTGEAMEEALERIASEASELSGRARKVLARSGRQAAEFAHDAADHARTRGRQAVSYASHEVQEHPLATIALGVAFGTAVGILLSRRRWF
jgi:ElaB/YqjD/DUF883 family membrane-anchored ribosome-binding protein